MVCYKTFNNYGEIMSREITLSVADIAKELNAGKATIKFLLKRFQQWLPFKLIDGLPLYPHTTLKKIILIQENLEAGFLLSAIEEKLDSFSNLDTSDFNSSDFLDTFVNSSQNGDIRLSNDGLILLKSLFNDIGEQQKRVAMAHEKRTDAEERKAIAIEKRAGAEEKKAQAMNNIANALQEMNKLRRSDPETIQIAHETATVIAIDEDTNFQKNRENLQDKNENAQVNDLPLPIKEEQKSEPINDDLPQLGDLSLLLDEKRDSKEVGLDDLSALIDTSLDMDQPEQEMDNLSALIDDKLSNNTEFGQMDDLSLLIDSPSEKIDKTEGKETQVTADQATELDDLSKLIDEPSDQEDQDMDDLSLLIDESADNKQSPDPKLDNLASLIESDSPKTDDLAQLIADDPKPVNVKQKIKVDITPEEDLEKYKAVIMEIIIELKTDGMDVEETTNRLNKNRIKTLSGKPEWTQKAISQIYKFIESAQ